MSTIKSLVPYQTETFRPHVAQTRAAGQENTAQNNAQEQPRREPPRGFSRPARSTPFLAQLIANTDADLRKVLGRQDIATARMAAYQGALANRPSATPLQFLHVIGKA